MYVIHMLFCFLNCLFYLCNYLLIDCPNNLQGNVKYVVRQVLPSGCEAETDRCGAVGTRDSLNLGGYGVELALKNMEYKAMDDSTIKKGKNNDCCL